MLLSYVNIAETGHLTDKLNNDKIAEGVLKLVPNTCDWNTILGENTRMHVHSFLSNRVYNFSVINYCIGLLFYSWAPGQYEH